MNRRERRAQRAMRRTTGVRGPTIADYLDEQKAREGTLGTIDAKHLVKTYLHLYNRLNDLGAYHHRDTIWRMLINAVANNPDCCPDELLKGLIEDNDLVIPLREVTVIELQSVLLRDDLTDDERQLISNFVPPVKRVADSSDKVSAVSHQLVEILRDVPGYTRTPMTKTALEDRQRRAMEALAALSDEDRERVVDEVNAAVGVEVLVHKDKKPPAVRSMEVDNETFEAITGKSPFPSAPLRNGETPSAAPRFFGKREARLSDLILAHRNDSNRRLYDDLRNAEKFVFDDDAHEKAFAAVKALSHEDLSLTLPDLRFPFRVSWFETERYDTGNLSTVTLSTGELVPNTGNLYVRRGFLIKTDETNQRGVFKIFNERKNGDIVYENLEITFDFTREWNEELDNDLIHNLTGDEIIDNIPWEAGTKGHYGPFLSRFSFVCSVNQHNEAAHSMGEYMVNRQIGHMLVSFLLVLAAPKQAVAITKGKRSVKAPDQAALRSRSTGRQCHGNSSEICRAG